MITAIDTNVIVALWSRESVINVKAQAALENASSNGQLVMPAPVFAELLACPGRDRTFLENFCDDTGMIVDWAMTREIWLVAGNAFQAYAARRKAHRAAGPRRILADFLIGAYAAEKADQLLTLDEGIYRAAFPALRLESF
jgi:predicted nucleic acid-binding protein